MRRTKLIWQLYPSFLLVTIASLVLVAWYGSTAIKKFYIDQMAEVLESKAYIAAEGGARLVGEGDLEEINRFCKEIGKRSLTRITVIAVGGRVLGDSEEDPAKMEDHSDRPEVFAAVQGELKPSIRFSSTLQKNMMYVAVPLLRKGELLGILRTSVPITSIDKTLGRIQARIFFGGLVIILVVAFISWALSRRISRPLEEIGKGVARFAQGNFSRKLPSCSTEEIASLASSMNSMAQELDGRMKAVLRQRNELEAVFSSMVEGVLVFDKGGRFLNINDAGADLFGTDPRLVKGKTLLEVVRNAELQQFVSKVLSNRDPLEGEITLNSPEGDRFFQAHGVPLKSATGEALGGLIVIHDVTALRRMETMRRDFVANVSHELKTPITSIQGFVETLLDGAMDDTENARKFLGIIAKQSRRLSAIIEDLLALARIEDMEETTVALEMHDLRTVIQSALQSCEVKAAQKRISLELDCPKEIKALMNSQLLEQAVVNLIDNAVKYGPPDSVVRLGVEEDPTEIRIQVRDNGPGIPTEHQSRLFERFYRIDKSRSKDVGGTGLGLAIVNHIAQVHGGRVGLESSVGRGSVFTLYLPKGSVA
jgi:two-component system phosphate regulon sensor histidine kinase PhoR